MRLAFRPQPFDRQPDRWRPPLRILVCLAAMASSPASPLLAGAQRPGELNNAHIPAETNVPPDRLPDYFNAQCAGLERGGPIRWSDTFSVPVHVGSWNAGCTNHWGEGKIRAVWAQNRSWLDGGWLSGAGWRSQGPGTPQPTPQMDVLMHCDHGDHLGGFADPAWSGWASATESFRPDKCATATKCSYVATWDAEIVKVDRAQSFKIEKVSRSLRMRCFRMKARGPRRGGAS